MRGLKEFFNCHPDVVRVEVVSARGSTPREAGAVLFVAEDAIAGTIGGGCLEFKAVEKSRSMIRNRDRSAEMNLPLGPQIGQCCGGFVDISLTLMDEEMIATAIDEAETKCASYPTVLIFGSGHVGRALAGILADMPVQTILVDSRPDELELCSAAVVKRLTPLPEDKIRTAPPGSAFVIATNDHAIDFLIAAEALKRTDAAYVGMIGSKTKRVSFERWHAKHAENGRGTANLTTPIGASGSRDKRPEVIAVFVAAEVMAALTTGQGAGAATMRRSVQEESLNPGRGK